MQNSYILPPYCILLSFVSYLPNLSATFTCEILLNAIQNTLIIKFSSNCCNSEIQCMYEIYFDDDDEDAYCACRNNDVFLQFVTMHRLPWPMQV